MMRMLVFLVLFFNKPEPESGVYFKRNTRQAGSWSLETSNQQPATSNQQPATSNQQPTTSNQGAPGGHWTSREITRADAACSCSLVVCMYSVHMAMAI
jgi:hypothetical protein